LQDPPKISQIWIFGLKTNHMATLVVTAIKIVVVVQGKRKRFVSAHCFCCIFRQESEYSYQYVPSYSYVSSAQNLNYVCVLKYVLVS
jgi:hypothetical protein